MSRATTQSDPPGDDSRRHDRRTAVLAAGGVLVLLVGLYSGAVAVAGDQIATGTQVAGVGIGGLTPTEAGARLRTELRPRVVEPIAISAAGTETVLDPVQAGLRLDVAATVDRAGDGHRIHPLAVWEAFFGGDRVSPVVRVDQERLLDALRRLADRTQVAPVEPMITFDGARPVVQRPRPGSRLDVGRSAVAVRDAWLVDERTVELPVTSVAPRVDGARLREAMGGTVAVLVSAPIKLRFPGRVVRLVPQHYAPALSVRVTDGRLRTIVNLLQLSRRMTRIIKSVERPARNARVEQVRGRPRVVPARDGIQVSPGGVARAVLHAAAAPRLRSAGVARTRIEAKRSTREVRRALNERRRDGPGGNPGRDGPGRDGPERDGPGRVGP